MSKPEIEVLDDGDAYPYSSYIQVEGTEVKIGDLLLVFESGGSNMINFFERVQGFTWPGIITELIDGPVPAEHRDFEQFAESLASQKIAIASERVQNSFFIDDNVVRHLSLYQYDHQPILVDEHRNPLSTEPFEQEVFVCADEKEVVELLTEGQASTSEEESCIQDFLQEAGYHDEKATGN